MDLEHHPTKFLEYGRRHRHGCLPALEALGKRVADLREEHVGDEQVVPAAKKAQRRSLVDLGEEPLHRDAGVDDKRAHASRASRMSSELSPKRLPRNIARTRRIPSGMSDSSVVRAARSRMSFTSACSDRRLRLAWALSRAT